MFAQDGLERQFACGVAALGQLLEHRRFMQKAPQVHRHQAKHTAQHEGNAPGKVGHRLRAVSRIDPHSHQRAQQNTAGDTGREGAHAQAITLCGHMLGHEDPGTGHFTADGSALQHTHQQQQQRRGDTDAGVGGQQANHQRGRGHQEDAEREHALAPQRVAKVGNDNAAHWPCQVARGKDAKGLQHTQPIGHVGGEEQRAQHGGKEHVDHEVVELERATQGRQGQGLVVAPGQWACGNGRRGSTCSRIGRHRKRGRRGHGSKGPEAAKQAGETRHTGHLEHVLTGIPPATRRLPKGPW